MKKYFSRKLLVPSFERERGLLYGTKIVYVFYHFSTNDSHLGNDSVIGKILDTSKVFLIFHESAFCEHKADNALDELNLKS